MEGLRVVGAGLENEMKIRIIEKKWYTPPCGKKDGITLEPFIFLRRPAVKTLLRHELIHIVQVRHTGWLKFYTRYLTSSYFRTAMEYMAYHSQADQDFLPPELEKLVQTTLTGRLHK